MSSWFKFKSALCNLLELDRARIGNVQPPSQYLWFYLTGGKHLNHCSLWEMGKREAKRGKRLYYPPSAPQAISLLIHWSQYHSESLLILVGKWKGVSADRCQRFVDLQILAGETLAIPCYGFQLQVYQEVNFQADKKRFGNIYNS